MAKISVIIPVYNAADFLSENIDSVTRQTYKDLEIIYIDDGSTDDSRNIIHEAAKKDNRIILLEAGHGGVSATRNLGLERASGEYISFVDSDDVLELNAYERMVETIDNNDYLLCFSYRTFGSEEISKSKLYSDAIDIYGQTISCDTIAANLFDFYNMAVVTSLCNKLFWSKLLNDEKKLRFDNSLFSGEDCVFLLEYLNRVEGVKLVSDDLYLYRIYGNQSINKHYKHYARNYTIVYNQLRNWVFDKIQAYDSLNQFSCRWIDFLERGCWETDWKDTFEVNEFLEATNSPQTYESINFIKRNRLKLRLDKRVFLRLLKRRSNSLFRFYGTTMRIIRRVDNI